VFAVVAYSTLSMPAVHRNEPVQIVFHQDPFHIIMHLSNRLDFFGATRDVGEVDFVIPVGFFGFERDVNLIPTDVSSAEIFFSLCCCLRML
jgi:hypothetical protein